MRNRKGFFCSERSVVLTFNLSPSSTWWAFIIDIDGSDIGFGSMGFPEYLRWSTVLTVGVHTRVLQKVLQKHQVSEMLSSMEVYQEDICASTKYWRQCGSCSTGYIRIWLQGPGLILQPNVEETSQPKGIRATVSALFSRRPMMWYCIQRTDGCIKPGPVSGSMRVGGQLP